jgi:hypothetical protein
MEVALNKLRSFSEYEVKEKNFGVIALRLKVFAGNQNEMTDDSNANLQ